MILSLIAIGLGTIATALCVVDGNAAVAAINFVLVVANLVLLYTNRHNAKGDS